jgi:FemAB-related protein (PEP-CTERM system-associated)
MLELETRAHEPTTARSVSVLTHGPATLPGQIDRLGKYCEGRERFPLGAHPAWLGVLQGSLAHIPYCLEATENGTTRGILALGYVRSLLFGRFLVSLPYVNYGGPIADDDHIAGLLLDRAVQLTHELKVRYLELRSESVHVHPMLTGRACDKVNMRRALPASADELWQRLDSSVRNQVRKGRKHELTVHWGGEELLREFYDVFARNMRDLGTPVYSKMLFQMTLHAFKDRAEICVVRAERKCVAAALLLHGWGVTEVPSASSLRKFNHTNANMLMYWHLLERAVERKQAVFDFGRSSMGSTTHRFKKQWGAEPTAAQWQYYLPDGDSEASGAMRASNPRYQRLIGWWKRLPVLVTRVIGPHIVRGIP